MEQEEAGQPRRRLVGIDLGIASRHSVRVLEDDGRVVCRFSCVPTVESLTSMERAALAGAVEGTTLAVVFEPTGPAWMPIAVFFARRGHAVYRVSSAKAADLRRFLRRHAKSNGIDAETLARMPLADPGGLQQLELPGARGCAGPAGPRVRPAHPGRCRAQDQDQGPGAAADAGDPADRGPGQGRPGSSGAPW